MSTAPEVEKEYRSPAKLAPRSRVSNVEKVSPAKSQLRFEDVEEPIRASKENPRSHPRKIKRQLSKDDIIESIEPIRLDEEGFRRYSVQV